LHADRYAGGEPFLLKTRRDRVSHPSPQVAWLHEQSIIPLRGRREKYKLGVGEMFGSCHDALQI
jgi:hypothetical protein